MVSYDDSAAKDMPGVEKIIDLGNGIAVVANNTWLAYRAAEEVDIVWEEAPYPPTTDAIFDEIAKAFTTECALKDLTGIEVFVFYTPPREVQNRVLVAQALWKKYLELHGAKVKFLPNF